MKKVLALALALAMVLSMAVLPGIAEEAPATYTFNTFTTTFPTNWSPHSNQTNEDSGILSYITTGLYTFDFNEDMDGYVIVPDAACDFPTDVTADYVGEQWGIKEGDTAKAWAIPLREDLCWEDGTPITAQDYVESAKLLLNPEAQNYRANNLYTGNLVAVNAEAYLKQGLEADTSYRAIADAKGWTIDELLANLADVKGKINWSNSFGGQWDAATNDWVDPTSDDVVETDMTVPELWEFYTQGPGKEAYGADFPQDQLNEFALDELFAPYMLFADAMDFDQVGVKATDDHTLVVILERPLEGFYLYYSLTDTWLVNADLYNKCTSVDGGVYYNSYGTSQDTTISFGPYKLTSFQNDKVYTLEKNEKWFGYTDPESRWADRYQTTCIHMDFVPEYNTAFEMFLNGKLDSIGLNKTTIYDYMTSDYKYDSEGDSIWGMVLNPDMAGLKDSQARAGEHINKTILTVKEFREGLAYGINRKEFIEATSPSQVVAFGLIGGQYVADPENGVFYRTLDEAKQVLVDFWGLTDEVGEGKLYADNDEAIDSLTGYNPEMAKEKLSQAYDIALEKGLLTEEDTIQICVGIPSPDSPTYNNGYDYIVNTYTELVKGTKLEGKLSFTRDDTVGNNFSDALKSNQVDMLFYVGWTGATFDPYGLMEVYTSSAYQYDPAFDATADKVTIELDGTKYTTCSANWQMIMSGKEVPVTAEDGTKVTLTDITTNPDRRNTILATLEGVVLQNYDFIPLAADASCSLKGMKYEYQVEDEVFPLGRGGVAGYTYNYTDAEWADFVASQGGTLNYK